MKRITIRISDDAYDILKNIKREGESFSNVIIRIFDKKPSPQKQDMKLINT